MANKFKCLDCKTTFYSETDNPSACPVCRSENLTPCSSNGTVQGILLACMSLVCIVIGYFATGIILNDNQQTTTDEIQTQMPVTTYQPIETVQEQPSEDKYPVITSVSVPTFKNGKYSFEVNASGDDLEYILYNMSKTEQIAVNDNGNFSGIAPSSDGLYQLVVRNSSKTQLSTGKVLQGFEAPVAEIPSVEKISQERIQSIINSGSMDQTLYDVSRKCKVNVTNLSEDDMAPGKITEVINNIPSPWKSVKVESVSYDSHNYIKSITITVVHDK